MVFFSKKYMENQKKEYGQSYYSEKRLYFCNMIHLKEGFSGQRMLVIPKYILDKTAEDPILSSLCITDIGHFPNAANHYLVREKGINQYVFIYCISGSGEYQVDKGPIHTVRANQYFILPAGKPHYYASHEDDPWTIYWIHFQGTLAPCYTPSTPTPMEVSPEKESRISNRINLFEEIFSTLQSGLTLESLSYSSSLLHHYLGSLRYIRVYRSSVVDEPSDINVSELAIHYMRENMEKRLSLQEIAKFTGYSSSRFSSLFKEQTGFSPLSYLNLLKIQEACRLFDSTPMTITQVSYKVGFDDSLYFSRIFHKLMGMSPREYKNRVRG